jgi:acetylornithine/N-succinyldiaminopimelate aminotransferase
MAVAEVVLDEVTAPGFLEDVRRRADIMRGLLAEVAGRHPDAIAEIRGRGFLCGVRLAESIPAGDMVAALRELKILTVPAGENTVRFLPPLIVTEDEIRLAVDGFDTALSEMDTRQAQEQAQEQDGQ